MADKDTPFVSLAEKLQEPLLQPLLAWAGLHRGKAISETAMPGFHAAVDELARQIYHLHYLYGLQIDENQKMHAMFLEAYHLLDDEGMRLAPEMHAAALRLQNQATTRKDGINGEATSRL